MTCGLEILSRQCARETLELMSIVPYLSKITVLHYLISCVLKTIVLYVLHFIDCVILPFHLEQKQKSSHAFNVVLINLYSFFKSSPISIPIPPKRKNPKVYETNEWIVIYMLNAIMSTYFGGISHSPEVGYEAMALENS